MPVAAAGAAATVAVGYMQSRASNNAAKARTHSDDAALAYQREQDAGRRAMLDKQWADYQKRYDAWEARNFGGKGGGAGSSSGPSVGPAISGAMGSLKGASVADLMQPGAMGGVGAMGDVRGPSAQQPVEMDMNGVAPGASLADLAKWSDHRQYLGGA